jgi:hypothetical protein
MSESCEDLTCGAGTDWPNCSADCVCACHDINKIKVAEYALALFSSNLDSLMEEYLGLTESQITYLTQEMLADLKRKRV